MSVVRSLVAASAAATLAAAAGTCPVAADAATGQGARGLRAAATATAAQAPATPLIRWVCRGPADVFDTPDGIVIGVLARGDHVRVLLHAAGQSQWVFVHGPIEIRGWMRTRTLC